MRTITLGIPSRAETSRRVKRALEGEPQEAFISFETPPDPRLWAVG